MSAVVIISLLVVAMVVAVVLPIAWAAGWVTLGRSLRPARLAVYFEPRDAWVGIYVAENAIYVCLLPFVVIRWWRYP